MQKIFLIQNLCAEIDRIIAQWMDAVLHSPRLQNLESSWRALNTLVLSKARQQSIIIKLLSLNLNELNDELMNTSENRIFELIYTRELGQAGGEAYGLLLFDFVFNQENLSLWENLAQLAAESFCIILLPGLKENIDQGSPSWEVFRQKSEAGFLGLCLGRIVARELYNSSNQHKIMYEESKNSLLFKQSIWLYAELIIRSFIQHAWFYDLNSPHTYLAVRFEQENYPITSCEENYYPKERLKLSKKGFICLLENSFFGQIYFSAHQSLCTNKKISGINSIASGLCFIRIAHYLKILLRDKLTILGKDDCEKFLQDWLQKYCLRTNPINTQIDFKYPLEGAKIKITENQGKKLNCLVELKLKNLYGSSENSIYIKNIIPL